MTRALKLQKILMPVDGIKKLQLDYGVSKVMVYRALKYGSNSELAKAIRRDAVEKYGGVDTKVPTLV